MHPANVAGPRELPGAVRRKRFVAISTSVCGIVGAVVLVTSFAWGTLSRLSLSLTFIPLKHFCGVLRS